MFVKESHEFIPGVFCCRLIVGTALIAEKPVIGIGIKLQRVFFSQFLKSGLDLLNAIVPNERIGIPKEQANWHCDVFYCLNPLI